MIQANQNLFLHFQQTLMGVIKWDNNFKIIDMNTAVERIFGYKKEEALGQFAIDLLVPGSAKKRVAEQHHLFRILLKK